ncbi:MAG: CopG family transcriptional regulator [Defluviitaleaceae bacterium]|nr:CopG family transcriptional regulator [Defluviitaleaceae bacterium]
MSEFNPSKTEKTVITLRIEVDVLQEIDILSAKADISRNEFIMQCIDFAMNHHPSVKSEKQKP